MLRSLIMLIFFLSCSIKKESTGKYATIIRRADKMDIAFSTGPLSVSVVPEKNKDIIAAMIELFNGKEERCSCDAKGYIGMYAKDSLLLSLWFTMPGSMKDCAYLVIKEDSVNKCYRLNKKMEAYLSDLYDAVKK
jgi:hypothetical protein